MNSYVKYCEYFTALTKKFIHILFRNATVCAANGTAKTYDVVHVDRTRALLLSDHIWL